MAVLSLIFSFFFSTIFLVPAFGQPIEDVAPSGNEQSVHDVGDTGIVTIPGNDSPIESSRTRTHETLNFEQGEIRTAPSADSFNPDNATIIHHDGPDHDPDSK